MEIRLKSFQNVDKAVLSHHLHVQCFDSTGASPFSKTITEFNLSNKEYVSYLLFKNNCLSEPQSELYYRLAFQRLTKTGKGL